MHHQCNCAPQLPSSSQLLRSKQQQVSLSCTQVSNEHQETSSNTHQGNLTTVQITDKEHNINSTSKPMGPAMGGAEPWQLQYYNPSTCDIIDHVKQFSHCNAASLNAFPLCPAFNTKAVEYIEEAIAKCQE